MRKSIGCVGLVLAIVLLAASPSYSKHSFRGRRVHVSKVSGDSSDAATHISRFGLLVRLQISDTVTCSGFLLSLYIVVTSSSCIDSVESPSDIVVTPSGHRKDDWSFNGDKVCPGKDSLAGKVSFLLMDGHIDDVNLFQSLVTNKLEQTSGLIFGFGSEDSNDRLGSIKPFTVESCPEDEQIESGFCASAENVCPADLGGPILKPVEESKVYQLLGVVSEIEGEDGGCQSTASIKSVSFMDGVTEEQLLNQVNECEADSTDPEKTSLPEVPEEPEEPEE